MKFTYFPDHKTVKQAIKNNDPLLVLLSFDSKIGIVSNIDDAMEHVILLKKIGRKETEIDSFFRIVLNHEGADWTFVCPADYQGIRDRGKRIEKFYNDGHKVIEAGVRQLGYDVPIKIPSRFRRHFTELGGK
jgi:hypothetical protein